uniref:Uncharacterized protein n=1 Tax=Anguilla anguilla TaxID=7936 RepID=A0A0E9SRS7_ANGAN
MCCLALTPLSAGHEGGGSPSAG